MDLKFTVYVSDIVPKIIENSKKFYIEVAGKLYNLNSLKVANLPIQIECSPCNIRNKIGVPALRYHLLKNEVYRCFRCRALGSGNPFYGRKHSSETKIKIVETRKASGRSYVGDQNPFFGKHHSAETMARIRANSPNQSGVNNPFYGKKHSPEAIKQIKEANISYNKNLTAEGRQRRSDRMSRVQKQLILKDSQAYSEMKRKAGRIGSEKHEKYKMNKLERKVDNYLKSTGLNFKYSVILGHKQFDFGNKESGILIEVQGDYWHGNPKIYNTLNSVQSKIVKNDISKREFADKNGIPLLTIWESDIKANNWKALEGLNDLYKIRTSRNK